MNDTYIDINTGEQVKAWQYTEHTDLRQLIEHLPVDNVSVHWDKVSFYERDSIAMSAVYSSHLLLTNYVTPDRSKVVLKVNRNSWIIIDCFKDMYVLSDSLFKRFYK